MLYFDSDVIFNSVVIQDHAKNQESHYLIFDAIADGEFAISTLVIQEVGYGLARFNLQAELIKNELNFLSTLHVADVNKKDLRRAIQLSEKIGFKHINDCIHTAIAENAKCRSLYTYNKSEFAKIRRHTDLEIVIL